MEFIQNKIKIRDIFIKFLLAIFVFALFLGLCQTKVFADDEESQEDLINKIYQEQMELSGADYLKESLPPEVQNSLSLMGVKEIDWQELMSLSPDKFFAQILLIVKEKAPGPIKSAISILAVILICALMESFNLSITQKSLTGAAGIIGTLSVCVIAIEPIVECIGRASGIIKGAAGFMLLYIPVITGIMVASGQAVSAASYNMLMMASGEVVSQIASNLLVPLLNLFLAVSVVSSISPSLSLSGICNMFSGAVKWILTVSMTIFVSLLTVQSIVGASVDSTASKAFRFVISSFVPVVGGIIGDAFTTVQSCIKLLKSGVGAFGILSAAFIFVPIIIECVLWIFSLNMCAVVSDIFNLNRISSLLKSCGKVLSTMLAIIICCMMILIVSTVIILIVGGGTA